MNEYPKIQTVFKRDPNNKFKTLLMGEYALPELEYLKDCEWVFTEKVDGTNIRVMWNGNKIAFGGKSDNSQIQISLFDALQLKFLDKEVGFLEKFGGEADVCLYGEGYGAKIQKGGGNYRQDQGFVLFDVKIGDWWLKREDVEDVADKLILQTVPIIGHGTLEQMVHCVSQGFNSQWGSFQAEGIVARPKVDLRTRRGDKIITKIKHKDFPK